MDVAAAAGPGVGAGIGAWGAFRFLRWLIEFVFRRLDISRSHLGDRLRHVEIELDAYREATMLMIGVVAKIDPDNPALQHVAQILRTITPRTKLDLDELERRLSEMPGTREARNAAD